MIFHSIDLLSKGRKLDCGLVIGFSFGHEGSRLTLAFGESRIEV